MRGRRLKPLPFLEARRRERMALSQVRSVVLVKQGTVPVDRMTSHPKYWYFQLNDGSPILAERLGWVARIPGLRPFPWAASFAGELVFDRRKLYIRGWTAVRAITAFSSCGICVHGYFIRTVSVQPLHDIGHCSVFGVEVSYLKSRYLCCEHYQTWALEGKLRADGCSAESPRLHVEIADLYGGWPLWEDRHEPETPILG